MKKDRFTAKAEGLSGVMVVMIYVIAILLFIALVAAVLGGSQMICELLRTIATGG